MPVIKRSPKKYQAKHSRRRRASAFARYGKAALSTRNMPIPSRVKDVSEWASMSVLAPTAANPVVNTLYQFNAISLANFPRATQVGQAYQMYRIKKVSFRFKPTYDTFAANGGNSKLNLYYIIDKTGSIPPTASVNSLKQMGARSYQFDEEPVTVEYAPAVLDTAMLTAGGVQVQGGSQYTVSPWLSTNQNKGVAPWVASNVDHLGISWYVEQAFAAAVTTFEVDLEVQFEFKKALYLDPPGEEGTGAILGETLITKGVNNLYIGAGASNAK